ncbi:MAG: family 16 glycosylhydrolase [Firmicutes bacterium]|nr:family 16 glycosylhydrolase [Bacillota bacterium]
MKNIIKILLLFIIILPVTATFAQDETEIFYDDFSGLSLDYSKWLTAEKNWGGTVVENGKSVDYNGGVIAENVHLQDGKLILTGCGNLYEGAKRGINRNGQYRDDGKRCGAAIATKEYFASGSYEIYAKISPEFGCCSAMWTFEYEEDYTGDELKVTNHEIDIEFPGRDENNEPSLSHCLCTTWVGEGEDEHKTGYPYCGDQADGKFHTYRFDWHTGDEGEEPRVEYYFDNALVYTSYEYIPTNAGRLWLGLWFPRYWAGTPDFDKTYFEIDYVKITPFREKGDKPQNESYPDSGWRKENILRGDVNGDDTVDLRDAIEAEKNPSETYNANADVNDDEKTDRDDTRLILKSLLS